MKLRNFSTKITKIKDSHIKFIYNTPINRQVSDSLCEIVYNYPQKMNIIDYEVQVNMFKEVKYWKSDVEKNMPRVLLMYGANDKAFCAGGDVKFLITTKDYNDYKTFLRTWHVSLGHLSQLQNSYQITLWNGFSAGGAIGWSVFAPIRIATEKSQVTMPETQIGFFTNAAASYFFSRTPKSQELGMYMALTGAVVKGTELMKTGFATHYMKSDKQDKFKKELIGSYNERMTIDEINEIINYFCTKEDSEEDFPHLDQIKEIFQYDSYVDVQRRINSSNTLFARDLRTRLEKLKPSPLSQAITFSLIQKYSHPNVSKLDAFYNDYQCEMAFFEKPGDFTEGVRAKLVDKDNNPKWRHKSLLDVSEDEVLEYVDFKVNETKKQLYDENDLKL